MTEKISIQTNSEKYVKYSEDYNLEQQPVEAHHGPETALEHEESPQVKSTRKDLQIPRRLFHMGVGSTIGLIYSFLLTHERAIYILGTCACVLYIFEQIRINYPKVAKKLLPMSKYILRAEEQLKESASVPMVIGLLLTIITFPKAIALIGIYTLAIADPMSAIIGIRFGKTHIVKEKSLEGSLAFFICSFVITFTSFSALGSSSTTDVFLISFLGSLGVTAFEMIPLKLDDNLTIPLFSSFWLWLLCGLIGISV